METAYTPLVVISFLKVSGGTETKAGQPLDLLESMSSNAQLSDEAQHLALVLLFRQRDEHDLAKLAEEVITFSSSQARRFFTHPIKVTRFTW